jgi:hypothetical protein
MQKLCQILFNIRLIIGNSEQVKSGSNARESPTAKITNKTNKNVLHGTL